MDIILKLGIVAYPLFLCSTISIAIAMQQVVFVVNIIRKRKVLPSNFEIPSENFLRFIISFTPMLGLLGTAIGITSAFDKIQHSSSAVTPSMISAGLYEALLTTIFGLSIALFSLFWLNVVESICNLFVKK
jgi:biopolymer transport protein ExbB/TolQ